VGWQRPVPDQVDADATARMTQSFVIVRVVRGSLLLVFLALAVLGVVHRGWPNGVAVALALAMVLQTGALAANVRRLLSLRPRGRGRPVA
jgi:hypothetical protein